MSQTLNPIYGHLIELSGKCAAHLRASACLIRVTAEIYFESVRPNALRRCAIRLAEATHRTPPSPPSADDVGKGCLDKPAELGVLALHIGSKRGNLFL